jgi:rhamnosyltransferase
MSKSISIGFVIYNPSLDQLKRIRDASRLGFSVYVYDNTPDKTISMELARDRGDIIYLTSGKNVGLGLGIRTVCAQAYYDNHSALVFFDQDTVFNAATLKFVDNYYNTNLYLVDEYSAVLFNSKYNIKKNTKYFSDVSLAINSGSLFFLENLKSINWHNSSYFVDCVDYDFCLRSQIHGFKIGEFSATPGFNHSIEQDDSTYLVFNRTYLMRAYSRRRIADTFSASCKLLLKSFIAGRFKFFFEILKLLFVYMSTQLFVNTIGLVFKVRNSR